jgi:4a-hydroxytetrahydrobiopterin dehydratase
MATKIKKLSESDVKKKFSKISEWNLNTKQTEISKTFLFASFMHGFAFVAKVAVHAEVMGHHPDIELSYGKVKVKLTTHDVKGLTNADFELAKKIDGLKIS